jgi:hypothetical protein
MMPFPLKRILNNFAIDRMCHEFRLKLQEQKFQFPFEHATSVFRDSCDDSKLIVSNLKQNNHDRIKSSQSCPNTLYRL